jgi:hypothetical protein
MPGTMQLRSGRGFERRLTPPMGPSTIARAKIGLEPQLNETGTDDVLGLAVRTGALGPASHQYVAERVLCGDVPYQGVPRLPVVG